MKANKKQRKAKIRKRYEKGALKLSVVFDFKEKHFILNRRNEILWRIK